MQPQTTTPATAPAPLPPMGQLLPVAEQITIVDIGLVDPSPTNPRRSFPPATLEELAASIRIDGIQQPIVARLKGRGDRLEIVAGERRYRAAKIAGLTQV